MVLECEERIMKRDRCRRVHRSRVGCSVESLLLLQRTLNSARRVVTLLRSPRNNKKKNKHYSEYKIIFLCWDIHLILNTIKRMR